MCFVIYCRSDASTIRPGAPCDPNEYNFNYKRRGVFLVINNKVFDASTGQSFREGSDLDAERLEERFQALGFEVRRYDDLTANQMSTLFFQGQYLFHIAFLLILGVGFSDIVHK